MPRADEHVEQTDEQAGSAAGRSFWSGTISFGLVSVPVSLFPANRAGGVSLRMLAPDGTPLARRYYCPKEEKPVDGDDLVRGFEVGDGDYVVVTDEELEALAPEKSRDIDLREFVPAADIDPMFFERAYYLAPNEASNKAYRLLAEIMERTHRAGIATFVMRGKEYLVAILAERGILRAETLRFADELRSADDIGLPGDGEPGKRDVTRITKAMSRLGEKKFDPRELRDERAEKILALVREKEKRDDGVVKVAAQAAADDGEQPVDLIRMLSESLSGRRRGPSPARRPARGRKRARGERPLEKRTKPQLTAIARKLGVEAASRMRKDDLVRAIRRAERAA